MRAGAGGTYNDDCQPRALGPDGGFYRSVIGGLVRVRDGGYSTGRALDKKKKKRVSFLSIHEQKSSAFGLGP